MGAGARSQGHRPQLDSLRTVAVFTVMLGHFAPTATGSVPLGNLGVRLFFVLSGFLITGILLRCRSFVASGARPAAVIGRFYARRLLRIAPAFYGLLAVMWIAGVPEVRDSLPWHLTYMTNVYLARLGDWHGSTSHFWSLAVEEQFYLVWPAIVLFMPPKRTNLLVVALALSAPLVRLIGAWQGWSPISLLVLPIGSADSLALGALLASLSAGDSRARERLTTVGLWAAPVALAMTVLAANQRSIGGVIPGAFLDTLWSLAFVWLIDRAAGGFRGAFGALLENRALVYLGRISYGLYLIHPPALLVVERAWSLAGFTSAYPPNALVGIGAPIAVTIVLASLSWRFYEGPINRLKRYVPYDPRPSARPA
jgi:peptidoglycan/LPS O-acetylase OafA/YrhL